MRCPHCGRPTALPVRIGGLAAAVGIGASLAGGTGCFELPPAGGEPEDAGAIAMADYGIAVLPDGGSSRAQDAGEEDAGMAPVADYGIVLLPDGGTP